MKYQPKYLSSREILLKAGYSDEGTFRGMTRKIFHRDDNKLNPKSRKKAAKKVESVIKIRALALPRVNDRYHAYIHTGEIDLHVDKNEDGQHKSAKHNFLVQREVLWFGLHDTPSPPQTL